MSYYLMGKETIMKLSKKSKQNLDSIINQAEKIYMIKNIDELKSIFSGLVLKIASIKIQYDGYYTCIINGEKTLAVWEA